MREGESGGEGRSFESAVLLAAMPPVVLAGGGRDVPPGQILALGIQAGQRITADPESGQDLRRRIRDPLADRGERPRPSEHRRYRCQ